MLELNIEEKKMQIIGLPGNVSHMFYERIKGRNSPSPSLGAPRIYLPLRETAQ